MIFVDDGDAAVAVRSVAGTNPAVDVSPSCEARTLPSGVVLGGAVAYEAAEQELRSLSSSEGTEIVVLHPEAT